MGQHQHTGRVQRIPVSYTHLDVYKRQTKDRTNYQGKAFDFIGFDELTHFEWEEYSYMMSRNRPTGPVSYTHLPH